MGEVVRTFIAARFSSWLRRLADEPLASPRRRERLEAWFFVLRLERIDNVLIPQVAAQNSKHDIVCQPLERRARPLRK